MRYWEITGLENGLPIQPFYVECETIPHDALEVYGDASRSYVEISKEDYAKAIKQAQKEANIQGYDYLLEQGFYTMDEYIQGLKNLYLNEAE